MRIGWQLEDYLTRRRRFSVADAAAWSQVRGELDRRHRPDRLAGIWEDEIVPLLQAVPNIRAVALFEEIRRRHPRLLRGCVAPWSAGRPAGERCTNPAEK
jgi:hypothetical protein